MKENNNSKNKTEEKMCEQNYQRLKVLFKPCNGILL